MPQRKNNTLGVFEAISTSIHSRMLSGTSRTLRPYNEDRSLEYYRNNWAPFNIFNEYANNKMNIDVLDFKIQGEATYRLNDDIAIKTLLSTRQAYTSTTHEVHEASNIVQAFRANENPFVAQQNIYLVHDKDNPQLQPKVGLTHGGILNKTEASLKSVLARIALDFDKRMGEHDLKALPLPRYDRLCARSILSKVMAFSTTGEIKFYTNPLIFSKLIGEGNDYFNLHKRNDRGLLSRLMEPTAMRVNMSSIWCSTAEGSNTSGKGSACVVVAHMECGSQMEHRPGGLYERQ